MWAYRVKRLLSRLCTAAQAVVPRQTFIKRHAVLQTKELTVAAGQAAVIACGFRTVAIQTRNTVLQRQILAGGEIQRAPGVMPACRTGCRVCARTRRLATTLNAVPSLTCGAASASMVKAAEHTRFHGIPWWLLSTAHTCLECAVQLGGTQCWRLVYSLLLV